MLEVPSSHIRGRLATLESLDARERRRAEDGIREIFFTTSTRQHFSSAQEREHFFQGYTAYYLSQLPAWTWLYFDSTGNILGYLTGCPNSSEATPHLGRAIGTYSVFSTWFAQYPAHLHINVTPSAQGQGVGQSLMQSFLQQLSREGILGVHLVTAKGARNIVFYSKLGFTVLDERLLGHVNVILMGLLLSTQN